MFGFRETDFLVDFEVLEALGVGVNGAVVRARRRSDGVCFAVKVLARSAAVERELGLWQACLPHPHIVDIVALYVNVLHADHPLRRAGAGRQQPPQQPQAWLIEQGEPQQDMFVLVVMPCMEGGDLFARVAQAPAPLGEEEVRDYMEQASSALAHLHARGVVHGDVKLENFVLRERGGHHLCLCDFGFARWAHEPPRANYSLYYIAPELIAVLRARRGQMAPHFADSADAWALGVMLYLMVVRAPPFPSLPWEPGHSDGRTVTNHIQAAVQRGAYVEAGGAGAALGACSLELRDLLRQLLWPAMAERATVAWARAHPWLQVLAAGRDALRLGLAVAAGGEGGHVGELVMAEEHAMETSGPTA